MRWLRGFRTALLIEYALWVSLIGIAVYVGLYIDGIGNEHFREAWVNPTGALTPFLLGHAWLTVPLSLVLGLGYLCRRAVVAWQSRQTRFRGEADRRVVTVWPIWPIILVSQAFFAAAVSDVLLMLAVNLWRTRNAHWVFYPWGVIAIILCFSLSLRTLFHPMSAGQLGADERSDIARRDRNWDWFGEAMIAAGFSYLLLVDVLSRHTLFGDPLTIDFLPTHLYIFLASLLPIALMVARRGVARLWRLVR